MDLPSEPEESGRPEQASAGAERLSPKSRELPDPDERGRVYEATRAHAEARAAERPEQVPDQGNGLSGPTSEAIGARFRAFGGCGQTTRDDGRRTGSQRQATDGPTDPPGSYRGNGGFCLSARSATRKQPTRSAGCARLSQRSRRTRERRKGEHVRRLAGRLRPSAEGRRPPQGEGRRVSGSRAADATPE